MILMRHSLSDIRHFYGTQAIKRHYLILWYFTGYGAKRAACRGAWQHEEEIWHVHPGHSGPPPGGERECTQGESDDDWHHQSKGLSLRSKVTVPIFAFKHRPRYLCCTQYLRALCFCFIQTLFFVTVVGKVMKFGIYV